jgi:hypothetical protein
MSKHQRGKGPPRFVQLFHWMLNSTAWRDLNAVERSIYLELTYRYNGSNNGRIGYSARQGGDALKISKATAARALRSLQAHGFIVVEKRGAFHCKDRHASEYRLTIYDSDIATDYASKAATKEFMRWPEIQNTIPVVRLTGRVVTPYGTRSDTVGSNNGADGICSDTVGAENAR